MKKKSTTSKKTAKKKSPAKKKVSANSINERLVENFVSLQKVMTNMVKKFDNLAGQINKLLELFEVSAKVLAEKDYKKDKSESEEKKIKENLENLLEQNKIIARGLTLMNEKILEDKYGEGQAPVPPKLQGQQAPNPQQKAPVQNAEASNKQGGESSREVGTDSSSGEYEKSLSTSNTPKRPPQNKFKKLPSKNQ